MFAADPESIEANVSLAAVALAQVLDGIREYSDATNGSIIDLEGTQPILFQFGEFDGATSSGFIAAITLTERSTE
jgi:hypothetical protein